MPLRLWEIQNRKAIKHLLLSFSQKEKSPKIETGTVTSNVLNCEEVFIERT